MVEELVQENIGRDGDALVVEKAVIELFSTVANLSNSISLHLAKTTLKNVVDDLR